MKSIILIVVVAVAFLWSCEDMYEKQKEFMGEVVYPARFDTIIGNVGFERVELDLFKAGRVPSSQINMGKSKKTVIEYDDQVITIDSLVSYVSIDGLTQPKLYRFFVYTIDEFNNKSVPQEIALVPFTMEDVQLLEVPPPKIKVKKTASAANANINWASFSSVLLDYKALTYKYIDQDGNTVEGASEVPQIDVGNIALNDPFTIYAEYEIIPKINGKAILDSAPMRDTITFLPLNYYVLPIFMLTSSGSDFITIEAADKGVYIFDDTSLKNGDKVKFFSEPSLDAELQYGFDYFNNGGEFNIFGDAGDENDNLVVEESDGVFDFTLYLDAKIIQGTGAYGGVPWPIPGIVEAEDFNIGGQGVGYNDSGNGNNGNEYRDTNVDIGGGGQTTGLNVGWTSHGEWLKYTVNIAESGMYHVDFSQGSGTSNVGQMILDVDGKAVLTYQATDTGGWGNYSTFNGGDIHLEAGKAILTINMINPGLNFDSMTFYKL